MTTIINEDDVNEVNQLKALMDDVPAIRWVAVGDSQLYMAHTDTMETK